MAAAVLLAVLFAAAFVLADTFPPNKSRLTHLFLLYGGQNWARKYCDDSGHVTGLNLTHNNLVGPFPNHNIFFNLPLTHLDLSHNKLFGDIRDINDLTELEYLDASHNQLTGTIPDGESFLKKMKHLDLSHNELTGLIPDSVWVMEDLEALDLSHNGFRGSFPDTVRNAAKLKGDVPDDGLDDLRKHLKAVCVEGNKLAQLDEEESLSYDMITAKPACEARMEASRAQNNELLRKRKKTVWKQTTVEREEWLSKKACPSVFVSIGCCVHLALTREQQQQQQQQQQDPQPQQPAIPKEQPVKKQPAPPGATKAKATAKKTGEEEEF